MNTHPLKILAVLMAVGMITACSKSRVKPGATANPDLANAAVPVNPDSKQSGALSGTVWQLERIEQDATSVTSIIDNPKQYTLTLFTNNTYQVKADCNRMQGSYMISGSNFKMIEPGAATLAECGPSSHYSDFLSYLSEAVSVEQDDDKMVLKLQNGGPSLIFGNGGIIVKKP